MTHAQKAAARPKCRKMLEKYNDLDFLLDDESYFTMSISSLPGNDRFYSSNVSKTPESVKNKYKAKFEPKLLFWICISPKGLSEPFFTIWQCGRPRCMPRAND